MWKLDVDTIDTDVLVIGGGAAGLRAAIEARRHGVKTLLISKTMAGFTSCSIFSAGGFAASVGTWTKEDHFRTTITGGRFLNNQKLVEVLVDEATFRILELQEFGVKLRIENGSCAAIGGAFPMNGSALVGPLVTFAGNVGVEILEFTMITDLLNDGAVKGAVGFNVLNGKPIALNAKAVILATGGAGQAYKRNDNPIRITGDGYALVYELGLPLIDMEFVQFWPTGSAEPKHPSLLLEFPTQFLECGALQNVQGEDIAKKHKLNSKLAYSTDRDLWALAIAQEILESGVKDDAVLFDFMKLSERLKKHKFSRLLSRYFNESLLLTRPIHVSPLAHHFMGGILIDENCRTTLPGLFAAGEVVGEIHGANRFSGNALTECMVFGAIAGRSAAYHAKSASRKEINVKQVREKLGNMRENADRVSSKQGNPKLIKQRIQEIMWKKAGVIRSHQGLANAQVALAQLREENLPKIYGNSPREIMEAIEATNLFVVAGVVVKAALERKESRGAHYRTDYPYQDDQKWLTHTMLRKRFEGMDVSTYPVTMTKLFPTHSE